MTEIIKRLGNDRIKIIHNHNPIPMELFLKFIKVETNLISNNLGYSNGWRERRGINNLIISSGIIDKIEYLDSLQYGNKLANPWNNFVNPFYIFDILNKEGKEFFIKYYKTEIDRVLNTRKAEKDNAIKNLNIIESSINNLYNQATS